MNDPYNQLSVASGVTDGSTNKPEVYYEGEPRFWFWYDTVQEVASLERVWNHPVLGFCRDVRTSAVLRKFDGGFETRNTIYKELTPQIRATFAPKFLTEVE
jgi:hypothetical protein